MEMLLAIPGLSAASATAGVGAGLSAGVGAATAVAASGFSLSGLLSGGFSAVSALASLAEGNAAAATLENQALWEGFNERRELSRGKAEATAALRAGNDAIAAAQVAGFASGLQSSGSVLQAKLDASEDAAFNVGMARDEAAIAAGARRGQRNQLRLDARAARRGGLFRAITTAGNAFSRFRGTG